MSQEELEKIVIAKAEASEGADGAVRFLYDEIPMALLSDTNYYRMRIIAPILRQDEMYAVLGANFILR
jgi:hypothetical protein